MATFSVTGPVNDFCSCCDPCAGCSDPCTFCASTSGDDVQCRFCDEASFDNCWGLDNTDPNWGTFNCFQWDFDNDGDVDNSDAFSHYFVYCDSCG